MLKRHQRRVLVALSPSMTTTMMIRRTATTATTVFAPACAVAGSPSCASASASSSFHCVVSKRTFFTMDKPGYASKAQEHQKAQQQQQHDATKSGNDNANTDDDGDVSSPYDEKGDGWWSKLFGEREEVYIDDAPVQQVKAAAAAPQSMSESLVEQAKRAKERQEQLTQGGGEGGAQTDLFAALQQERQQQAAATMEERTLSELSAMELMKIDAQGMDAAARQDGAPLFQAVDGTYTWIASFFPSFRGTGLIEISSGMMIAAQQSTGIPWSLVFFGAGLVVRLATLYFALYGDRAARRLEYAMSELQPALSDFQNVYYNPESNAKEIQVASTTFRAKRKEIFQRHETSNLKAAAAIVASPFISCGFITAVRLSGNGSLMANSGMWWMTTMGQPDPLFVIPTLAVLATFGSFVLTLYGRYGKTNPAYAKRLALGGIPIALAVMPGIAMFRTGVVLYWTGLILGNALQPILMSSREFRIYFKVPEPIKPVDSEVKKRPFLSRLQMSLPQVVRDFINIERTQEMSEGVRAKAETITRHRGKWSPNVNTSNAFGKGKGRK